MPFCNLFMERSSYYLDTVLQALSNFIQVFQYSRHTLQHAISEAERRRNNRIQKTGHNQYSWGSDCSEASSSAFTDYGHWSLQQDGCCESWAKTEQGPWICRMTALKVRGNNWLCGGGLHLHSLHSHLQNSGRLRDEHLMLQNCRYGPAVYDSVQRFLNSRIRQSVCCSFWSALQIVSDRFRPWIGSCVRRDRSWQVNICRSWCFLRTKVRPCLIRATLMMKMNCIMQDSSPMSTDSTRSLHIVLSIGQWHNITVIRMSEHVFSSHMPF